MVTSLSEYGASPGRGISVAAPDGTLEPLWIPSRMDALLAEHESDAPLAVAGAAANRGRFRDCFDRVVQLSAPRPVLLERVARRTANPFGHCAADRARIAAGTDARRAAAAGLRGRRIDTRRPLADVVDALEVLARARSTRQRRPE